jgi:hypothetical protein
MTEVIRFESSETLVALAEDQRDEVRPQLLTLVRERCTIPGRVARGLVLPTLIYDL